MEYTWHGNAAVTLRAAGLTVLVDPLFTQPGHYGPWHQGNPRAPALADYLASHQPDWVVLTHGHWDHFDIDTVKALEAAIQPNWLGSAAAMAVLLAACGADPSRCHPLEPGEMLALPGGHAFRAIRGEHWFTGPEGDEAARKLAHHYGAMPCGGPMLQIVWDTPAGRIYVSGDTLPDAVPRLEGGCRLAVLTVTHRFRHPKTGVWQPVVVLPDEVPAMLDRLQPAALAPVHWDARDQEAPLDPSRLAAIAAAARPGVSVLLPAANTTVPVPATPQ